jgi:hypothetical protein
MGRRTAQLNRSREWDGILRFEYASEPSKNGQHRAPDSHAQLERLVKDQGERIARLEAAWSLAIAWKGRRTTNQ